MRNLWERCLVIDFMHILEQKHLIRENEDIWVWLDKEDVGY